MAAYINRIFGFGDLLVERRNPLTDEDISSPLQIFGQAKKLINKIFVDIHDFVALASERMTDMKKICPDVIVENELKSINDIRFKVKGICEVLTRDQMKVAFYGRISSGKSTVINAMLGENVLPTGIGHTTNRCVQVEGSQTGDAYLVTEGSNEKQNVESVTHLAHALHNEKELNVKELVHVYWPKDKCSLLRNDVALVDYPGVDYFPHMDDWIDAHCIDADVFVFVVYCQTSLTISEKNFYHNVSTKLSNQNIFILNNYWDCFAVEPEYFLDQERKKNMERTTDFLVKELKVCTPEEAVSRIFFISAKEVLRARVNERNGQALNSGALAEGFSARYMEFEEFEHRFEECISKSAIKTKFLNRLQQGKHLVEEMYKIMDTIYNRSQELIHKKMCQKKEILEKLNFTEQQLICITNQIQTKIHQVVDDVEDKVPEALNDEIRRLSVLVDEFNVQFLLEPLHLNIYKIELHNHVESVLVSNLRAKLSTALAMNIDQCQREMIDKMSTLLPEDKRNINVTNLKCGPFEALFRLNCDKICVDFHEQLEFKFSWGLSKLVTRISSLTNWTRNQSKILISPSHIPSTSAVDGSRSFDNSLAVNQNVSMIYRVLAASVGTQGTVGGFVLAGFMLKTVGWRLIVAAGAVYGVLYLYERLSWTTKAKEREFKRQYVHHATSKLRSFVDIISKNCSHQVKQELYFDFKRLCLLVDESATNLNHEMKNLDQELNMLNKPSEIAEMLKNEADLLKVGLKQLGDTFLCVNN